MSKPLWRLRICKEAAKEILSGDPGAWVQVSHTSQLWLKVPTHFQGWTVWSKAWQIRTWHHNSLGSLTIIICWCLLRIWPSCLLASPPSGKAATLHSGQGREKGDPNSHSLLPFPREQAASRIKSHQQGQVHTGADWAAGMPLWDYQGQTLLCEVGCYLLTPKAQTCHPQAFLSCLPHLSPISLNPAILSPSFLNSRLLLVVLSASSRLIVSKADISSMRVSDRFGLTFYDTSADSTLPPQIQLQLSKLKDSATKRNKTFLPFIWRFPLWAFH